MQPYSITSVEISKCNKILPSSYVRTLVKNFAGSLQDSVIEETKIKGFDAINSLDEDEISESRSEAATTHLDSDIFNKQMPEFMIPWVERVVQDNKVLDLVR